MLAVYNTALLPLRLVAEIWGAFARRDAARRAEWAERLGRRLPTLAPGGVWIHGASVGEARIVAGLASELRAARPERPLAVSAYTSTGRAGLPAGPAVDAAFFLPLDFPGAMRRLLDTLRPAVLVLVETELWPNLLHEARRADVPALLVNGRLSPKRMARYRRWSRLYRPAIESLSRVGAQSAEDAARFISLGARRDGVSVTGNIKYDLPSPSISAAALRQRLSLDPDRPVFVAGSTAPGEDAPVLDAFAVARQSHPRLLLVLAPRHLERAEAVADEVTRRGLALARLSRHEGVRGAQVLLVDTLGELFGLYQLAAVAFVGGSLVPVGGHNVLEPAAVGVPVLFGPHTEHFVEPAAALERAGGGFRVVDGGGLAARLLRLLDDGSGRDEAAGRAARVVDANRGALGRSLELLLAELEGPGPRSAT